MLPLTQFVARPGCIDLAWGHPGPDLLPVEGLRQAAERVFRRYGPEALNYGEAAGPGPLIAWLVERLGEIDGRAPAADSIVISAGTSQALDLLATLLAGTGDVVLVEAPTYHLAVRIFRDHGLLPISVPMDSQGIRVDRMAEVVGRLRREKRIARFLYCIPTFHNPTGSSMSLERRRQLVELAAREELLIIEDDAYRELAYDGEPPPSLWALAEPGTVLRLGTFAKTLAPGLRSGFITADPAHASRIRDSGLLDSGGGISHFSSLLVAEFAEAGQYSRHVDRLRQAYRARRDALLRALAGELGERMRWTRPGGGYFTWLDLGGAVDSRELVSRAEAEGVAFMPGSAFYLEAGEGTHRLRLSFSRYRPAELEEAAGRLGRALDRLGLAAETFGVDRESPTASES